MGTVESARWIRVYAADIEPGDLVKFTADSDVVRVIDREWPPAWARIFRVRLDGDATTGLAKTDPVHLFDPDGRRARRVRVIIPEGPHR
jgi:hypothetical protein